MNISLIVAVGKNGEIGRNNDLMWKLSEDLKLFKKRTLHHAIIMGRKTFESIGRPLPKRLNIVITRNQHLKIEGCEVVYSLEEAIELAKTRLPDQEIFIIGGQQIFEKSTSMADKLYLTRVKADFPDADTFFDIKPFESWEIKDLKKFEKSDVNEYDFDVLELTK